MEAYANDLRQLKQETDTYHAEMENVNEALKKIGREAYTTKVDLRRYC